MAREHSFSIGLPDNIVYCKQFLETLQSKLDQSVPPGCCSLHGLASFPPGRHMTRLFVLLRQASVSLLRENLPG